MKRSSLLHLALSTAALTAARAADLTWDTAPGTVGPGNGTITGGTGTWNLLNGTWTLDAGANNVAWDNALHAADTAVFGGTGGTVTVNNGGSDLNVGGVRFAVASYTIAATTANDRLNFGGAQGAITSTALGTTGGNQASISANLAGTAGLTLAAHGNITNGGGGSTARLNLSGTNTGLSGGIAITGGLVNFSSAAATGGNAFTLTNGGGLIHTAGALTLANDAALGTGGGTMRVFGSLTLTLDGTLSGGGGLSKTDGGTLVLSGNNSYSGGTNIGGGFIRLANTGSANALGTGTVTFAESATLANGTGAGATAKTLANALSVAAAKTASFDAGFGDLTLSGGISGAGAVTKSSTGTLTLSGANTHAGITTVNGGTLGFGGTGSLANNANFLINGATVNVGAGESLNLGIGQLKVGNVAAVTASLNQTGGTIASTGPIWVADAATTTIGNMNLSGGSLGTAATMVVATRGAGTVTVSGSADVSVGTVQYSHPSGADSTGVVHLNGGTLAAGQITDPRAGSTTTFNFNGGLLKATATQANYLAVDTANVRDGGAKIDTNGHDIIIAKALTHSAIGGDNATDGGLIKSGTGTLTLSGTNTYTGPTTVNAGTLQVSGSLLADSDVLVANGAELRGNGSVDGDITVAAGGTITGGDGVTGTLFTGDLTFNATGTINVGDLSDYITFPAIDALGTLTLNGGAGAITVNLPATPVGAGTYHVLGSATPLPNASGFVLGTTPTLGGRQVGTLTANGGLLDYVVTGVTWTGALSDTWSTTVLANPKNWALAGAPTDYLNGDAVTFDDTVGGGFTDINLPGTVTAGSVAFNNAGVNYSISGAGSIAGAGTTLRKSGTADLTLNTANTYGSGTTLGGGRVILGHASALGSGDVSLVAGTLDLNGQSIANGIVSSGGAIGGSGSVAGVVSGSGLVVDATGIVSLDAANSYTGTTTILAGTLQIGGQLGGGFHTGSIANGGAFVVDSPLSQTLSGVISGSGSVGKGGAGTLVTTAVNTFAGALDITGGTYEIQAATVGNASGLGSGAASNVVTVGSGATLLATTSNRTCGYHSADVNIHGGTVTFDTLDNSFGSGRLITFGTAPGTIGGSGQWRMRDGNVRVLVTPDASGSTISVADLRLTLAGGAHTFEVEDGANAADLTVSSVVSSHAAGDGITKTGAGTLLLTAANTYTGPTTITAGTLEIGGQLGAGTYAAAVTNNAALVINSTAAQALNGAISGSGSLAKSNSGALTLGGINTYTGNTTVTGGSLTLADNAGLRFVIGADGVNNRITGTGTVDLAGDFTLDLSGAGIATGNSWTLVDVATLDEEFMSTFTLAGFTESSGVHTMTDGGGNVWTFRESDGVLEVEAAQGYDGWATTHAPGQTPEQDFDNDGVPNDIEYVLGGLSTTNDLGKLPAASVSGGNLVFTFVRDQDSKTPDTTVVIEVGTTLAAWPATYTVGNDTAGSSAGVTVTDNGNGTDTVTLTVTQAPDAKKFARLKVTIL